MALFTITAICLGKYEIYRRTFFTVNVIHVFLSTTWYITWAILVFAVQHWPTWQCTEFGEEQWDGEIELDGRIYVDLDDCELSLRKWYACGFIFYFVICIPV